MEIIQFIQTEWIYLTWISDLFTCLILGPWCRRLCWEYSSSDWWLNWQNEIRLVNRICMNLYFLSIAGRCMVIDFPQKNAVWSGKVWYGLMFQNTDSKVTKKPVHFGLFNLNDLDDSWRCYFLNTNALVWLFMSSRKRTKHTYTHPKKKYHQDIKIIDSSSWLRCLCFLCSVKNAAGNWISLGLCGCQVSLRTWSGTTEARYTWKDTRERPKTEIQNDNQQKQLKGLKAAFQKSEICFW